MNVLLLKIVNMSISASWLILAILVLRLLSKKAPKWINVLLWGIVAVRLICPFTFESDISLVPSAETIPLNIEMEDAPVIDSGIEAINNVVNPVISDYFTPQPATPVNPLQIWILLASVVWLTGMTGMLLYAFISYFRIRSKVSTAVLYRDNIFQSENVVSPFVLGMIRTRIYLPYKIAQQELEHVIAHENAHIERKDHWWKPLGFLLLAIHWLNPLMWVAYVLLCRDIELACDEKVIRKLDNEQRADYTQALVNCSVNRRMIAACPLAFGEVSVKERVKNIMNYKRPAFWIIGLSLVVCIAVAVCFLTNPKQGEEKDVAGEHVVSGDVGNRETEDNEDANINENELETTPNITEKNEVQEAYATLLAGVQSLVSMEEVVWWIPPFQGTTLEYEYTYMDLDGDGVVELLVQMVDNPSGYNGVFHYEEGKLICWQSDAMEMSCWDYPLADGSLVRQYDQSGNVSYTIFQYLSNGEMKVLYYLFAREELIDVNSTEPCPYYTINGEEVTKEMFEGQIKELITDKVLIRENWIKN